MYALIRHIGLRAWAYVALAFASLLILAKAYQLGSASAKVEGMENTIDAVRERDKDEAIIRNLSDDDVTERLRELGRVRD